MAELAAHAEEHDFEVVWVTLQPGMSRLKARAIRLATEHGFGIVDVYPVFQDYLARHGHGGFRSSPLAVSPSDPHPSSLAHQLAARELARALVAQQRTLRR